MKRAKISRAMDHLDDELIAGALENKTATKRNSGGTGMTKANGWKKWGAIAAAFAIMLTAVIVMTQFIGGGSAGAVIAFDVNPSLEIEVDKNEKVVKVNALNEDAVAVIGNMDFEGAQLELAVNAIIGSMLTNGYLSIDQNSILVSVDSSSTKTSEELQKSISDTISKLLENKNIDASVLTQGYTSNGEGGKEALIEKIIAAKVTNAHGEPYTREQLSALNVNELKLMLESKDVKLDGVGSSGSASEGKYIGRDAALAKALAEAEISESAAERIRVELDYEDDFRKMVYEVEFKSGNYEYEFEIDAVSGLIMREFEDEFEDIFDIFDEDDDNQPIPEGCITRAEAIAIALKHAGVTEADVTDIDCDFEKGWFGKLRFEVSFEAGRREFEYEIDAKTGEIKKQHSEYDD